MEAEATPEEALFEYLTLLQKYFPMDCTTESTEANFMALGPTNIRHEIYYVPTMSKWTWFRLL